MFHMETGLHRDGRRTGQSKNYRLHSLGYVSTCRGPQMVTDGHHPGEMAQTHPVTGTQQNPGHELSPVTRSAIQASS